MNEIKEKVFDIEMDDVKPALRKTKRKILRNGFILANVILIAAVIGIVWAGRSRDSQITNWPLFSSTSDEAAVPLDLISSADIAANIATVTSLPEAIAVINQADSMAVYYLANSIKIDQTIVSKPAIVSGGTKSRKDIATYITVSGDTVSSLAERYGVTSDSIKWSNGLYSNYLSPGLELKIPPVNGIVYKVRSGDTVASLASRYQASQDLIVAFNDIELSGLPVGEYIVIPDGVQAYYAYTPSVYSYNFIPQWAGNGYYYGYCTYYAATRVQVPSNWGNANTWDDYARLSGWIVSSVPVAGAIAQSDAMSYLGHVGYVDEVSADGTMIRYSDMNALCGWGCVGYSDWVPSTTYQNYIYR